MELKIKYHNGEMVILIDSFLNMRNITKFKKLLKIIDTSYTPEARDVLKDYITNYLATVDTRLKEYANEGVTARTEYKEQQILLETLVKSRDIYKKKSREYKYFAEKVKKQRERIRHLKAVWKSQESYFNNTLKNKEFYKKCLDLL